MRRKLERALIDIIKHNSIKESAYIKRQRDNSIIKHDDFFITPISLCTFYRVRREECLEPRYAN